MKKFLIIVILVTLALRSFSQQSNRQISPELRNKIIDIEKYVYIVDTAIRLFNFGGEMRAESSYSGSYQFTYSPFGNSAKVIKIVSNNPHPKTIYYKDNKAVYSTEMHSVNGNYSDKKICYFRGDTLLLSTDQISKEHILKVEVVCYPAPRGTPYNFTIEKNSITFEYPHKIISNSLTDWNQIIASINLTDFDKIKSGVARAYLDGEDLIYTITTDKQKHVIINASLDDPAMIKLKDFFKKMNTLIPQKQ